MVNLYVRAYIQAALFFRASRCLAPFSVMAPKRLPKANCKPVEKNDAGTKKERWQFSAGRFVYQAHLDLTKLLAHFGNKVLEYSMAHEVGTHDHTDVFLVFRKQQSWTTLAPAIVDGLKPHFSPNTTRGSAYRTACNREPFYNQCVGKKGTTARDTNLPPGEAYAVKTKWVQDLYQQGKLDTPLEAASMYKCFGSNR